MWRVDEWMIADPMSSKKNKDDLKCVHKYIHIRNMERDFAAWLPRVEWKMDEFSFDMEKWSALEKYCDKMLKYSKTATKLLKRRIRKNKPDKTKKEMDEIHTQAKKEMDKIHTQAKILYKKGKQIYEEAV